MPKVKLRRNKRQEKKLLHYQSANSIGEQRAYHEFHSNLYSVRKHFIFIRWNLLKTIKSCMCVRVYFAPKNATRRDKRSQNGIERDTRDSAIISSSPVLVARIWYKELLSRSRAVYLLYPFAGNIAPLGSFRSASRMGKRAKYGSDTYPSLRETRIKCRIREEALSR